MSGEVQTGHYVRIGSGVTRYQVLRVRRYAGRLVADLAPLASAVGRRRYRYGVDTARLNHVPDLPKGA